MDSLRPLSLDIVGLTSRAFKSMQVSGQKYTDLGVSINDHDDDNDNAPDPV